MSGFDFTSGFAGTIALVSIVTLVTKVASSLLRHDIKVTRADTGVSVTIHKPSATQSRNERSAQAHKILELVDAD